MITCRILNRLYGRDTRPAQCLSMIMSVLWVVMWAGEQSGWFTVYLPATVSAHLSQVIYLFSISLLFSLLGFFTDCRTHQVAKTFGLVLGGLSHIIIANSYATAYPPLDPVLLLCVVLGMWFLGAVFFVLQCEGINGNSRTEP